MATIYGLTSTRDGRIRYVGETFQPLRDRFDQHYWNKTSVPAVRRWIREERFQGFDMDRVVIETCDYAERRYREWHWIERIPRLLNERKNFGWEGSLASDDERVFMKRVEQEGRGDYVENWNGWTGVRHYPRREAWRVHIATQDGWHMWLRNDGGPVTMIGYSWTHERRRRTYHFGDRYFQNSHDAIEARDHAREWVERVTGTPKHWPQDRILEEIGWADFA